VGVTDCFGLFSRRASGCPGLFQVGVPDCSGLFSVSRTVLTSGCPGLFCGLFSQVGVPDCSQGHVSLEVSQCPTFTRRTLVLP